MTDIDHDERLGFLQFQRRLSLGCALDFELFPFLAPVEHVPGSLNPDAAQFVWKGAAVIDRPQADERETHVRDSFGTFEPALQFGFSLLDLGQTDFWTGCERLGVGLLQRYPFSVGHARWIDFERRVDRAPHEPIELLLLRLDRVVHLEEGVLRLRQLSLDREQVGLESHPLDDLLVGLAIELLEKVDGREQRLSTALCLRNSVIQTPNLVDDSLPLRTELLARGIGAHTRQVDSQPDLVLLAERLGHAGVPDEPELEGTRERRRPSWDWAIGWIDAQAASFQRDP
jgi:hypothetical protein